MTVENSLTVQVVDHRRRPVPGAKVFRSGREARTQLLLTDHDGKVTFDVPADADAELIVQADGFADDSRPIGPNYPAAPNGVQQFFLGPAGWPRMFRGRIRVPVEPIVDAVGIVQETTDPASGVEAVAGLIGQPITDKLTYFDDHIAVAQLSNLHRDSDEDGLVHDQSPDRLQALDEAIESINNSTPQDTRVGAIVSLSAQGAAFLTDGVVVSLHRDDVDITELADRFGFAVSTTIPALGRTYLLKSGGDASYGLLDRIEALAAEPGVRYAEPDLIMTMRDDAVTPNDYLFGQQWDHRIINTPDAWQVLRDLDATQTFGDPEVIVAVVDRGISVDHRSFTGNVSNGQPKIARVFDFRTMTADNNNPGVGDSADHGMACASAAVGRSNNGVGTAGVAGNCRVIGVRRGGSEAVYAQMYLWLAGLDADSDNDSFPAPLNRGADVITNSFGPGTDAAGLPIVVIAEVIREAFDTVTDQGRGGVGHPTVLLGRKRRRQPGHWGARTPAPRQQQRAPVGNL